MGDAALCAAYANAKVPTFSPVSLAEIPTYNPKPINIHVNTLFITHTTDQEQVQEQVYSNLFKQLKHGCIIRPCLLHKLVKSNTLLHK